MPKQTLQEVGRHYNSETAAAISQSLERFNSTGRRVLQFILIPVNPEVVRITALCEEVSK